MRYSFSLIALAAIGAHAVPQESVASVQPITQISDGQIQAPPATSLPAVPSVEVPELPTDIPTAPSVPTLTDAIVEVPTSTGSLVVPLVPTASGNSTGSATKPSGSANATFSSGGRPSSTGEGEEPAPNETNEVPSNSDSAAAGNVVSFGGLVVALGAALFM